MSHWSTRGVKITGRSHRRVSEHTAAQRIERRFHVNAAIVSDASSRVKGSLRHVFMYEVVELQQDKKVVFAAASELHTATEQLIFMPDPNDPTFTVVRHISHVELTEWRRALQPVVAGVHCSHIVVPQPCSSCYGPLTLACHGAGLFKQLPDKGLQKLRTLLNSANTPLRELREAEAHAARRGREGGWGFTSMFNSEWQPALLLSTLLIPIGVSANPSHLLPTAGLKQEMAQESWATGHSTMSPGMAARAASQAAIQSDAHGYYALLGLDGRRTQSVGTDDIKTAFRKAAQNLHPDKYSLSDDEERMEAEEAFKKVQRAYAVLKDPQQRKLYDSGKLNEETSLV
ncbi:J domain-containing protein [Haematococcus lacustris]|uniref:J domain-containing protein n=2 Tax=Haematococcus lacustris TaxID=44745 RepID=A0A699Z2E6_HAELA|nr:J domain-containing protein [Haematococcus lacustris]